MKKIIVLIATPVLIIGCKENSALSEVELNNPRLISPEIVITKHVNELGREKTSLVVYLNDKNDDSIDLLNGSVSLNKKTLGVYFNGEAPYYSLGNVGLIAQRNYTFNVRLADGQVYPCSINSPKKLLTNMSVPDYHDIKSPLIVSWSNTNESNTGYSIEISSDNITEEIELIPFQARMGSYIIPSSLLYHLNHGKRGDVYVTIKSCTSGKVDPKFNGGSIKIVESICKQVTLRDGDKPMEGQKEYQAYSPS